MMTFEPIIAATPTVFFQNGVILASSRDVAAHLQICHRMLVGRIRCLRETPRHASDFLKRCNRYDMTRAGFDTLIGSTPFGTFGQRSSYRQAFDDMSDVAASGDLDLIGELPFKTPAMVSPAG